MAFVHPMCLIPLVGSIAAVGRRGGTPAECVQLSSATAALEEAEEI
jgi:hypothetical protein